ncbi:MAG: DUF4388 domain-containing protein, partial [Gemmatimonadales bacterium]
MAIEGPLKELGLHDVFQLLDLSRKTGVMRVTSQLRDNEGMVAFDRGTIVFAEMRTSPLRIGELLVKAGRINDGDLERARAIQQKEHGSRRLGQVLVEMGAISDRELVRQVEFQVTEVVFHLLSWQEGFFSFREGPLEGVPADAMVKIRTESVLMEGERRDHAQVRDVSLDARPLVAPARAVHPHRLGADLHRGVGGHALER